MECKVFPPYVRYYKHFLTFYCMHVVRCTWLSLCLLSLFDLENASRMVGAYKTLAQAAFYADCVLDAWGQEGRGVPFVACLRLD